MHKKDMMHSFTVPMRILIAVIALALAASCTSKSENTIKDSSQTTSSQPSPSSSNAASKSAASSEGHGIGVVKALDASKNTVELDHGDIPGVMEGMDMEYPAESNQVLQQVAVGDSVDFTLKKRGEGDYVVSAISKIAKH